MKSYWTRLFKFLLHIYDTSVAPFEEAFEGLTKKEQKNLIKFCRIVGAKKDGEI